MIKTFNFKKPSEYVYDTSKIELTNGVRLISPYETSSITTQSFKTVKVDGFDTSEITGTDNIQYILTIDGNNKYYNSGWEDSDGTYAQSNLRNDINSNIASLITGTSVKEIKVTCFLYSSGASTPILNSVVFYGDLLTKRTVYGFVNDVNDNPVENVQVVAKLPEKNYTYGSNVIKGGIVASTFTASNGYWELELISNLDLTPNELEYEFIFNGKGISKSERKRIPNVNLEYSYNSL